MTGGAVTAIVNGLDGVIDLAKRMRGDLLTTEQAVELISTASVCATVAREARDEIERLVDQLQNGRIP